MIIGKVSNRKIKRIFTAGYLSWLFISLSISVFEGKYISTLITDLPDGLKTVSPILLSFIYLNLFLPAIISVISYTIIILFIPVAKLFDHSPKYFPANNYK